MAIDGGSSGAYNLSTANSGNDRGHGTWEIVAVDPHATKLVLTFYDGRTWNYDLSLRDGLTYLGEKKFFRTTSGADAPDCF